MDEPGPIDTSSFRELAHEMSNSLAYVVTNLNLLNEELESADPRVRALVEDALEGSERIGGLVRTLRRLSWGAERPDAGPPTQAEPSSKARILVIDDEQAILTAVKRALRSHQVSVVTSAEEALRKLEANEFELVLCDLMMPGMTGIELYHELERTHKSVLGHLVFMTAGGFTSEVRHFLASVDNGVLHKPFDVKTLRWVVSQKLNDQRAR